MKKKTGCFDVIIVMIILSIVTAYLPIIGLTLGAIILVIIIFRVFKWKNEKKLLDEQEVIRLEQLERDRKIEDMKLEHEREIHELEKRKMLADIKSKEIENDQSGLKNN